MSLSFSNKAGWRVRISFPEMGEMSHHVGACDPEEKLDHSVSYHHVFRLYGHGNEKQVERTVGEDESES